MASLVRLLVGVFILIISVIKDVESSSVSKTLYSSYQPLVGSFDAIVSRCVPVIVSDKIELPYEDEIDYQEFSIFFSVKEALEPDYIVQHLRQIPEKTQEHLASLSALSVMKPAPSFSRLEDAKLARDFQDVLKDFQKAQQLVVTAGVARYLCPSRRNSLRHLAARFMFLLLLLSYVRRRFKRRRREDKYSRRRRCQFLIPAM